MNETGSDNDFVSSGFRATFHWLIQPGKYVIEQISAQLDVLKGRGDIGV